MSFLSLAKKDKFFPIIICATPLANSDFLSEAAQLSSKLYFILKTPLIGDLSLPITKEYMSEVQTAKLVPNNGGLEGYIEASVLAEAIRLTGKDLTRVGLVKTFTEKMSKMNYQGLNIQFTKEKHQALHLGLVTHLVAGSLQLVEEIKETESGHEK